MSKQHTWRELKKLVPAAPNEICRDIFDQLPFDDALNYLLQCFDQKPETSPVISPNKQQDMVNEIIKQFPSLDNDIALAILEEANNYLDVALENCKYMEQQYNKLIESYVPNEDLLYVDGPIVDNFKEEEDNEIKTKKEKKEKWTYSPPIIIQESQSPTKEEGKTTDYQSQQTFLIKKPTILNKNSQSQQQQFNQQDSKPFTITPPIITQAQYSGPNQEIMPHGSQQSNSQIVIDLNQIQNPNKQQWNPFFNIMPSEFQANSSSTDQPPTYTYLPTYNMNQNINLTPETIKPASSPYQDASETSEIKQDIPNLLLQEKDGSNNSLHAIHVEKPDLQSIHFDINPKDSQDNSINPEKQSHENDPQNGKNKADINLDELVVSLQSICEGFDIDVLVSALEKFNYSVERAANYLFDQQAKEQKLSKPTPTQPPPEKTKKLSKKQKKYRERFAQLPEQFRIYEETEEEKREKNIKYLQDMFPNAEPSYIASILDQSRGDVSGAAITLSKADYIPEKEVHTDPFYVIQNVFPSARDYEIEAALDKAKGNPDLAVQYILTQTFDKPPPEDAILAIRPDISAAHARRLIQRANGNIQQAIDECSKIGPLRVSIKPQAKPIDPNRSATIDLHNYRSDEAAEYVTRVIRNARGSFGVVYFITGKGNNSKNHIPILRPLVMKICRQAGANTRILPNNTGIVECRFVPLPY